MTDPDLTQREHVQANAMAATIAELLVQDALKHDTEISAELIEDACGRDVAIAAMQRLEAVLEHDGDDGE